LFDASARLIRSPGVRFATVNDEKVLLHLERGRYYALSASAALLWDDLESPRDLEFLVSTLTRVFDVDTSTARRDVEGLLRELFDEGLVAFEGD